MSNTATRLITLIFLLQNQPNQKASELAEKLGTSVRTVHRYFAMLDEMGIPVYAERGPYGGFSLVRGYKIPPLIFSLEEAVAVYLGTSLVSEMWGQLYREAAQGALAKLENILPNEQRSEIDWARRSLIATSLHRADPSTFFPILEEYRLMPYVDRWVVSYLAKRMTAAETAQPGSPRPRNSINLSTDTLRDENFAEFVHKRVDRSRLSEGTFTFEFPWDTAVLHAEPLMKLAGKLKPVGCHFTVAGFDGSKTSFDTLKRLRPNFVKLDYSIVKDIGRALAASERAESVTEKCHALAIKTIAEYVESAEALEQLQLVGVDYAQGLAISPPEPLK